MWQLQPDYQNQGGLSIQSFSGYGIRSLSETFNLSLTSQDSAPIL